MSTVGYGDIVAHTHKERIYVILCTFIACGKSNYNIFLINICTLYNKHILLLFNIIGVFAFTINTIGGIF